MHACAKPVILRHTPARIIHVLSAYVSLLLFSACAERPSTEGRVHVVPQAAEGNGGAGSSFFEASSFQVLLKGGNDRRTCEQFRSNHEAQGAWSELRPGATSLQSGLGSGAELLKGSRKNVADAFGQLTAAALLSSAKPGRSPLSSSLLQTGSDKVWFDKQKRAIEALVNHSVRASGRMITALAGGVLGDGNATAESLAATEQRLSQHVADAAHSYFTAELTKSMDSLLAQVQDQQKVVSTLEQNVRNLTATVKKKRLGKKGGGKLPHQDEDEWEMPDEDTESYDEEHTGKGNQKSAGKKGGGKHIDEDELEYDEYEEEHNANAHQKSSGKKGGGKHVDEDEVEHNEYEGEHNATGKQKDGGKKAGGEKPTRHNAQELDASENYEEDGDWDSDESYEEVDEGDDLPETDEEVSDRVCCLKYITWGKVDSFKTVSGDICTEKKSLLVFKRSFATCCRAADVRGLAIETTIGSALKAGSKNYVFVCCQKAGGRAEPCA